MLAKKCAESHLSNRDRYRIPASFASAATNELPPIARATVQRLCLHSLEICGLDLCSIFINNAIGFRLDFQTLTKLKLESCFDLNDALQHLSSAQASNSLEMPQLAFLSIRHEVTGPRGTFRRIPRHFLTSLSGLTELEVLVDNTDRHQNLRPILNVHGNTLESLLWDERHGTRVNSNTSTAIFPPGFQNLILISQKCPVLKALALPLDLNAITNSGQHHAIVRP